MNHKNITNASDDNLPNTLWNFVGKPNQDVETLKNLFDAYCEYDHKKYIMFLNKVKKLVDKCAEGHGLEVKN